MILDPRTPVNPMERFALEIRDLSDRIDSLANPTGTEAYQAVAKLQALVDDIQQQLDEYLANDAYTKAQVDALVASPGDISPGNVTTSGIGVFNGGLYSTDAYNWLVTGGGAYRATWTHESGHLGYAPSSRRFKTGERPARFPIEQVLKLQGVFFRYLARPPYAQEKQREELGLIAEDVEAAGFPWLVDRDVEGRPFGVRIDLLVIIVLEGMRDLYGAVQRLGG